MSSKKLTKKQLNSFSSKFTQNIIKKSIKEVNCKQLKDDYNKQKLTLKEKKVEVDKCIKNEYKYGSTNLTLLELLKLIKHENKERALDFIELFPFSGLKGGSTANQSLVFEALWSLIFLCSFDDLRKKNFKRIFKKKLEDPVSTPDKRSLKDKLDQIYVAESHSSGIADIYFEEVKLTTGSDKKTSKIMCNFKTYSKEYSQDKCSVKEEHNSENETFLFSAKYLLNERGISGYDIAEIYNEAIYKIKNPRVVLLVKNSDEVKRKKVRSKKSESNLVKDSDIYGINELNLFYNKLRENLVITNKGNLSKFIEEASTRNNELDTGINKINLRFHQQFLVNYTNEKIEKNKQNKFVWGAVPRSGKTFMIGGLISERKPNNVLIFLGAVTETNKQFEEGLFDEFKGDFGEYKIYSRHSDIKERKDFKSINPTEKNIILISLQKGWQAGEIPSNIADILKTDNKLVFFDESHQGGKGEKVEYMLKKYIFKSEYGKFPFIMVTATFATPLLRFGNENIWGEKSCLVQWSYEDIEFMKELDKEDGYISILERLESQDDGENRVRHFKNVLTEFEKNGVSRGHLADYYTREYPELVVLCPSLENTDSISKYNEPQKTFFNSEQIEIAKIFELKKSTQGKQFKNDTSVNKLLDFIKDEVYEKLLLNRFNYDVLKGKPHSQIWFLPTQLKTVKENGREKNSESEGFIEQLQFLLAKKIIEKMGDNFCVLLMHGKYDDTLKRTPKNIYKREFTGGKPDNRKNSVIDSYKNYDTRFYMYEKSNDEKEHCLSTQCLKTGNVGECIEQQQRCAYARNKNLIILTGARLRLGISMPCVDIALHMDPISNVDTIYQSMFRVLTGTENKKRGYFVDLLKERMIKFVYQYNNYTNKLSKSRLDIKAQKTNIQKRLFSWNFNGLNQFSGDSNYKNIYKSLVEAFALTDTSKFSENLERFQENSTVKEILEEIGIDVVKDIYKSLKQIGFTFTKGDKGKISIDLLSKSCVGRCGKSSEGSYQCSCEKKCDTDMTDCCSDYKQCSNSEPKKPKSLKSPKSPKSHEPPESQEEEDKESDIYNSVTEYIKSLFSLYIIFYDEKDECINLNDLENHLKYPITMSNYKDLCKKDDKILECYLKFIIDAQNKSSKNDDIKVNVINEFKEQFKKILSRLDGKDIQKEKLNKFYCFIYDNINMLKESSLQDSQKIKTRCQKEQSAGGKRKIDNSLIKNETVLETIRKYLSVRDEEKKLFGEVFTPVELVCEMLEKLPSEVWKDPKLKWLDPANGIGNYPVVAYYKLMESLNNSSKSDIEFVKKTYKLDITNNFDRSKHIIENMLYMVELNPVNAKVCRKIFKMIEPNKNERIVEPNIYNSPFYTDEGSDLIETWKRKCPVKSFDVIMGNPPYNQGGIKSFKGTKGEKPKTIWPLFIKESFEILKQNGFLLFINPLSWLKVSHTSHKLLIEKYIIWLKLWDDSMSKAKIQADIPLSIFVLQNKDNLSKNKTTIVSEMARQSVKSEANIYLNSKVSIPLAYYNIFDKISTKIKSNPELVLSVKATTVKGKGDAFVLPKSYSVSDNLGVDTYTIKEGVKIKYMSKPHPDTEKNKLIIANKRELIGSFIDTGKLGLVGEHKFYILGDNLKLLQKFFNTKIAKILANNTKYGQSFLDTEVFKFIPDVRNIPKSELPEINDENLAKYFGYSIEEIDGDKNEIKKNNSVKNNINNKFYTHPPKYQSSISEANQINNSSNKSKKKAVKVKTSCTKKNPLPPCEEEFEERIRPKSDGVKCCYKTKKKPMGKKSKKKNT
jgi:hypothetical protein